MVHAVAYVVFILLFTSWLGRELKIKYELKTNWKWILGAFLVGVAGAIISNIMYSKLGNFILHASGGVSSVLLFIYLTKTLKLEFTWKLTLVVLFAFVSTLGVLNELAEYLFESLDVNIFSYDTHDTWRDFVANTTGAALTWATYLLITARRKN